MIRSHLALFMVATLAQGGTALAQTPLGGAGRGSPPAAATAPGRNGAPQQQGEGLRPLPPDSTTQQTINPPGRALNFSATAGVIRLTDLESGAPRAEVAYIAFRKTDADPATRPVAFVFNGGPGYASAWLNLGALGPWRLPMDGDAARPSAGAVTTDNADTWLDFTDLVFIDPPGTGYSRIVGGDDTRKALWSVSGDANALAATIRRWSEENDRSISPKFIVGESYGGFRAPKIAYLLQTDQGVGVNGVIMISPVLDFGRFDASGSIFGVAGKLPSMAAAARERKGPITRAHMKDVEDYAGGAFIADLMKGPNDKDAVERLSTKVAELTGLDLGFVRRLGGRVPVEVFMREFNRATASVSSIYDANFLGLDPLPLGPRNTADDQLRLGLHAPMIEAMVDTYRRRLKWNVEGGRYVFFNERAGRQWDYGRGAAESVSDLRKAMALDPRMRALVAHGLTDLATSYFDTKMTLDQIPLVGPPDRVRFQVYPGGHMMYVRDASRKALREDARKLIEDK